MGDTVRSNLLAAVAVVGSAAMIMLVSCQPAPSGLQGKLAWPKDGDLWVDDLSSRQQTKITNLPSAGAIVTGATWSPDGQRLIYAQFWHRPNERSSGADLYIANADGSDAHPFEERDAPSTVLETPQWMSSGRVYYTIRRVTDQGREVQTIVRQTEGGQPETVVDNGYDPSVSPDETTILYMRPTRAGQQLLKKTIGSADDGCELISDQVFQYLSLPRISPDGKLVALGGSGPPNMMPSGCGGNPPTGAAAPTPPALDLGALLQPETAYAHGLPADVYTLSLDGSGLKRVADIKDDDPTVAWSADGTRLAIFGVGGLFVSDLSGGSPQKIVDQGGYGGVDWTR